MHKVEQRHRDAAVELMRAMPFGGVVGSADVREGGNDQHQFVQAFARFEASMSGGWRWPEATETSPLGITMAEAEKAVAKFPTWPSDPFHALAVLGEEKGELAKAVVQFVYERHKGVTLADIREEAVQTAAMALRWIASIDRYDFTPGEQHEQPVSALTAPPASAGEGK